MSEIKWNDPRDLDPVEDIKRISKAIRERIGFTYLRPGEPCSPGCLSHVTHPCEMCGRIGGRVVEDKDVD